MYAMQCPDDFAQMSWLFLHQICRN